MDAVKDAVNEMNKTYNFPSLTKLIHLVQSKYNFSNEKIIQAVQGDVNTQLMQPRTKPKKKLLGHIISLAPNEIMQMDNFDMQRYKKDNTINKKTYPYILVLIDVFSRMAYIERLESKLAAPVLETFKQIVQKVMSKQSPHKVLKEQTKSYSIYQ